MNHFIVFSVCKFYCTIVLYLLCLFVYLLLFLLLLFKANPTLYVMPLRLCIHPYCSCSSAYSLTRGKAEIVQVSSYSQSPLHNTTYRSSLWLVVVFVFVHSRYLVILKSRMYNYTKLLNYISGQGLYCLLKYMP